MDILKHKMKKKTAVELKKELLEKNPSVELVGDYLGTHTNTRFHCKQCGNEWDTTPNNVLRGHGCPVCARKKSANTRRKSNAKFLSQLSTTAPSVIPLEDYTAAKSKIKCKCKECGHEWHTTPGSLLRGHGCPKCGIIKSSSAKTKTHSEYVEELQLANPNIELLERYTGSDNKILCRCKVCGNEWKASPGRIIRDRGCPRCGVMRRSRNQTTTNEAFLEELASISPDIEVLEEYSNSHKKILVRCKRCKHEWTASPTNLLQQKGCPQCNHTGTSFPEQIILNSLERILGTDRVLNRDRTTIDEELDIYIPELRLAIEYGAWYWHKDRLKSDIKKQQVCKKRLIRLITIFDLCPLDSIPGFGDDCLIYPYEIGVEKGLKTIREILKEICDDYKLDYSVVEESWEDIVKEARNKSKRKTTEQFIAELGVANPQIEIVGDYKDSRTKVECHCKRCGHVWWSPPTRLLHNHGCPRCATEKRIIARRKTNDQFVSELKTINPDIDPIEPYKGDREKIRCLCKKCANEWYATPNNLLRGRSCPKCGDIKRANYRKKRVICEESGIVYESATDAAHCLGKKEGSHITSCCRGKREMAFGYHWNYCD